MSSLAWSLLGRYLPRRGRKLISLGFLSAAGGVLEAAVLVLTVRAAVAIADGEKRVDVSAPLIGDRSIEVPTLLWWAIGAGLLSALAGVAVAWLTARASADVLATTRSTVLRAFSRASWHEQASSREGALQETISNNAMQASELTVSLVRGISALVTLAAMMAAALIVNAAVTGAVVGLGLLIVLLLRPVTKATRRRAVAFVEANRHFGEDVAEASGLAFEMRVFGVETGQAESLVDGSREASHQAFLTRFASLAGVALYRNAAILFLVIAAGGLYVAGDVNLSAVGAVVMLMVRALSYAQQAQAAAQRVNELVPNLVALDEAIEGFDAAREQFGDGHIDRVGTISLHNVSYTYGDEPALRNVDLELEPGELIGVVGPSGSGKTTLVQVLLRLRLPTTGKVVVDGRSYEEISPECWSRLVSLVPQDPRLFAGSVAENIAFHRPGITREQIVEAAVRAHLADEIEQLPGRFDAPVGARGSGLSGGQRQRLAIARALVGNPRLLVLDEPTSALDVHSERLLVRTISELEGDVTMMIVAHRLSTITACKRLMILQGGEIVALGPADEVRHHPFFPRAVAATGAAGD